MLGELLSAGAGILSGLFGSDTKKTPSDRHNLLVAKRNRKEIAKLNAKEIAWNRQVEGKARRAAKIPIITKSTSGVAIGRMMDAAERAGLNPVTFIQNGGMAAYTSQTQTVRNSNAFAAATVGLSKPAFQAYLRPEHAQTVTQEQNPLGKALDAFSTGINSFLAISENAANRDFQAQIQQAQLGAIGSRVTGGGGGGVARALYTPFAPASRSESSGPSFTSDSTKDPSFFGTQPIKLAPVPDVDDFWESRYGEPGEWIGGIINIGTDAVYSGVNAIKAANEAAKRQLPPDYYDIGRAWNDLKRFASDAAKRRGAVPVTTQWPTIFSTPSPSNSRMMRREQNPYW